MDCIKEKSFLFWRWKRVEHKFKIHRINRLLKWTDSYHVTYKCGTCGAKCTRGFVEQEELILAGIPIEILQKL